MNDKIITRFAPSPTGLQHIGGYRTGLFNYILAKKYNGKFILRIEDTDRARSKKEYADDIIENLNWLGLHPDEIFKQSDRGEIYKEYLQKLITNKFAYFSEEEITEKKINSTVIRFKNPNKVISFTDLVHGEIKIDTTDLGDFVIAKSLDEPLFHMVVVVDDFLMGITHIIRGDDHIPNTPRHILIQEAIGAPRPVYAHIPLVLATDRTKLSKRKGAMPMSFYREEGYTKDALINFMALIGWNPGNSTEVFSLDEIITSFNAEDLNKSGAIFNEEKLRWFNKLYINKLSPEAIFDSIIERIKMSERFMEKNWLIDNNIVRRSIKTIMERTNVWSDITKSLDNAEWDFIFNEPEYESDLLMWKKSDITKIQLKTILTEVSESLKKISDDNFTKENLTSSLITLLTTYGKGDVLWPLRYCLTGLERSPDPYEVAYILQKEKTLKRIEIAINKLN